jgi:S1-C subfamily serine protease
VLVGEISPALRSHLGLAPEEGLLVEEVLPDTRAERLGLRRYDVLLTVNGMSVGDPADVREALEKLEEDAAAHVTVVRLGKRVDLVEKR